MAKLYVVIPASAVYVSRQTDGCYTSVSRSPQCSASSPDALLSALARRLTQEVQPYIQTFNTLDEAKQCADRMACGNAGSYYILETTYKASPVYPKAANLVAVD